MLCVIILFYLFIPHSNFHAAFTLSYFGVSHTETQPLHCINYKSAFNCALTPWIMAEVKWFTWREVGCSLFTVWPGLTHRSAHGLTTSITLLLSWLLFDWSSSLLMNQFIDLLSVTSLLPLFFLCTRSSSIWNLAEHRDSGRSADSLTVAECPEPEPAHSRVVLVSVHQCWGTGWLICSHSCLLAVSSIYFLLNFSPFVLLPLEVCVCMFATFSHIATYIGYYYQVFTYCDTN